jgi:hypothetical protein
MNLALSLALTASLVASAPALAAREKTETPATPAPVQPTDNDAWSQLRQLAAGEGIRVVLGDATSHRGAFRIADDESITLVVAGHDQRVSRASIRRILVARGTHRRRNVLLGLVIGGATGGLIATLRCRGKAPSCKEVAPAYVYPFAGAGAGIGAFLPAREWQEIYLAVQTEP